MAGMRVCYILSTSEVTGGANRSVLDLLGALDRDKIEPIVLIKKHGDIEKALQELGIPVFLIPFINEVSAGNLFLDVLKRMQAKRTERQVRRFLKEQRVDLLHNNSLPALAGMAAAHDLGIPYICHLRERVESGLGLQLLNKKKHFSIVRKASCILAISRYVCGEYDDMLHDTRITVLHDGFDTSLYLNREKTVFRGDDINIAIYGNLNQQKGQMDAVKACELLQKRGRNTRINLYIIGNLKTGYADEVKAYVCKRKIANVFFSEPIRDIQELKASRAKMDINLICSSAEGLGRVTIESMLSGCLTIGADAGATPEILEDQVNGLLYENQNVADLADRIEWAISHRKESASIAGRGRDYAMSHFDIEQYAEKVERIYQQCR